MWWEFSSYSCDHTHANLLHLDTEAGTRWFNS
jgi:hypothetical protein